MWTKATFVSRLTAADPGWPEWARLVELAESLPLSVIEDEYLGSYLTVCPSDPDSPDSGPGRLTLAAPREDGFWPGWLPAYVAALSGLKAADYSLSGGYADAFTGEPTKPGYAFAGGVPDEQLGFPVLPVPPECYPFQYNASGALFHITSSLEVLYPDASRGRFVVLDPLEAFTRKNIQQALAERLWFHAYQGLDADIPD